MRSSRGEIKIEEILDFAGLNFKEEVSFPGLTSLKGNLLRFDFAVYDDSDNLEFLIEYNGSQHYKPSAHFGGLAALREQQYNDMKKREFCKKHNIPLVVIPYTDEGRITYDYIMKRAYGEDGP